MQHDITQTLAVGWCAYDIKCTKANFCLAALKASCSMEATIAVTMADRPNSLLHLDAQCIVADPVHLAKNIVGHLSVALYMLCLTKCPALAPDLKKIFRQSKRGAHP